jgi:hypothetical protein
MLSLAGIFLPGHPSQHPPSAPTDRGRRQCRGPPTTCVCCPIHSGAEDHADQVLVVSDLVALGYLVLPEAIDAEGNQDGLICGLPLPEPVRQQLCGPDCPIPITYVFDENDLPAQQ